MNAVPQPKTVLTIDEFLASLNQKNSAFSDVKHAFKVHSNVIVRIYKKDSTMYDVIKETRSSERLPIVDKPLQVVIEARMLHEVLTGALFRYHAVSQGDDPSIYDRRILSELYIRRGLGYYFSGAFGGSSTVVIHERNYKPDRFDKDLFILLGLG